MYTVLFLDICLRRFAVPFQNDFADDRPSKIPIYNFPKIDCIGLNLYFINQTANIIKYYTFALIRPKVT